VDRHARLLNRWKDGRVTIYGKGNQEENALSLFEDSGGRAWISTSNGTSYFENEHFVRVSSLPKGTFIRSLETATDIFLSSATARYCGCGRTAW
jgi:hypothetical protein